jgi:hypothetical protein
VYFTQAVHYLEDPHSKEFITHYSSVVVRVDELYDTSRPN